MSPNEPLFDFESCLSRCDSCDKETEVNEEHHALSAHRTGYGMVLCDKCISRLNHVLDLFLENKKGGKRNE